MARHLQRNPVLVAVVVLLVAVSAGCGGGDDGNPAPVVQPQQVGVSGTLLLPNGAAALTRPSIREHLLAWAVQKALALTGTVEPAPNVDVQLVRLRSDGSQESAQTVTRTDSQGNFSLNLPPGTDIDTCRFMLVAAGTKALVYSVISNDISFASDAAATLILQQVAQGANLCHYSARDIGQIVDAVRSVPGTISGSTPAEINSAALAAASANPNVQLALGIPLGTLAPATSPTATHIAPTTTATPVLTSTPRNTPTPTRTNTLPSTNSPTPVPTNTTVTTATNTIPPAPTFTALSSSPTATSAAVATVTPTVAATDTPTVAAITPSPTVTATGLQTPVTMQTPTATTAPVTSTPTAVASNTPSPTGTATGAGSTTTPTLTPTPVTSPVGTTHRCTFSSGTKVSLNSSKLGIPVDVTLSGHQDWVFGPIDATGVRQVTALAAGTHFDCVPLPLNLGVVCARGGADTSGVMDCNGTAGTPKYNNTVQIDHNSNNGNNPDFDPDPTCSATFTEPWGQVSKAVLESGSSSHPHTGVCNSPVKIIEKDSFPAGGFKLNETLTIRLRTDVKSCTPNPCPPDDAPFDEAAGDINGSAGASTGSSVSTVFDVNNTTGNFTKTVTGSVFGCANVDAGNLKAGKLTGSFAALDIPTVGDVIAYLTLGCQ